MKISLNRKFTLFYVLSSLLLIIVFFTITNRVINTSFQSYMEENQLKRDQEIINYLEEVYRKQHNINNDVINNLWHDALMSDYYITLFTEDMQVIWKMDREQMGMGMMHGMMMQQRTYNSDFTSKTYPIEVSGEIEGYVEIGQYGSLLLSKEDIQFRNSLYQGILLTAVIGIGISIIIGVIIARQFSKPILKIKEVSDVLRKGDLSARIETKSNTQEIYELSQSINYLASSLEQQETLRKRLTSDISHELRTPLNVLQNHIEALIDGMWEPTGDRLEICYNEVHRLTNLVKDLEKLTNLDQAELKLKKELYPLEKIIDQVIHQFEPSFRNKGIEITSELDNQVITLIDKDKITQVMINLLSNAFKFTDTNGHVRVDLYKENAHIIIKVSDNGIGIKEKDLNNIFERFYRGDPSRSRKTGGAGLGLSIVKQIIDAHSGSIDVHSVVNQGTTFTIRIPLV
ncbi:sensor histidine kinase [Vallitalea okinawensis]|uniref:sensor histidine kinase n=1 Tax=Vallitalea okinawensis TaxID=2078660 RepID=UPI001A9A6A81|nr:HAMP domain-containing sensor histidine kinase [Vallitalea okinawensis]